MDYIPLDLSPWCNAGVDLYETIDRHSGSNLYLPTEPPRRGLQHFHGIPFQIGPTEDGGAYCLIGLGRDLLLEPLTIPLSASARHLIFAHALLETELWQGGPPGETVARYRVVYSGGEEVDIPIRERFEVGNIPLPWGQFPFLALPDMSDTLVSRHTGPWEEAGVRRTEANEGWAQAYYLWAWENPHPERMLDALAVTPTARRFVLAAITLGQAPGDPFARLARRPLKITLLREEDAGRPFALAVNVDRGDATYPYTLPAQPPDPEASWVAGFGAPRNLCSSPAYSEISATETATVQVKLGDEVVGQVPWAALSKGNSVQTDRMRLEVVDPGRNWVRVEVVDDASGERLPCRVAFHSPEGIPYPPHGHHAPVYSYFYDWNVNPGGDVQLGQTAYACIDGRCEGWLPRGRVLVEAARGFEYEPLRQWVEIEPGQQDLTLRLRRWIDMNAERYFSGDTHVHFLSPQASHTEAGAEDLNVVNLLQSQWGHFFSNTTDFRGRPSVSREGNTIVYVSQENRQHILGHLSLLGLKEPVMPWCSGGPSESELGGSLETTLSHWADACHAQGGTVIIPHVPAPNGEPAALVATGRADAVEMLEQLSYEHLEYYRYLNGGYRLPLVGGTDKMSSHVPVGLYRTYVYIPPDQPFTYENWCRHLRGGHTFVSGGPLLWFSVEGQSIGSTLAVRGGGTVEVEATVRSIFPVNTLQVVQAGKVVAETSEVRGARQLQLHTRLQISGDTWLAARCGGPNYEKNAHFDRRRRGIMAHTSPIYVRCDDDYDVCDAGIAAYMLTLVEGGLSYIRQRSRQYPQAMVTHHHGQPDHQAYLEEPFLEARAALHRRLHQLGIPH